MQRIPERSVLTTNRVLRWSAWIIAVVIVAFIAASFAVGPLYAVFVHGDPQAFTTVWVAMLSTLNLVLILASLVAVVTLVICWAAGRSAWRPMLTMIGVGVLLSWIFGFVRGPLSSLILGGVATDQAALAQLSTVVSVVNIVIELGLAFVIAFGAVRLGRRTTQQS